MPHLGDDTPDLSMGLTSFPKHPFSRNCLSLFFNIPQAFVYHFYLRQNLVQLLHNLFKFAHRSPTVIACLSRKPKHHLKGRSDKKKRFNQPLPILFRGAAGSGWLKRSRFPGRLPESQHLFLSVYD
jgi:hypothetical protein